MTPEKFESPSSRSPGDRSVAPPDGPDAGADINAPGFTMDREPPWIVAAGILDRHSCPETAGRGSPNVGVFRS